MFKLERSARLLLFDFRELGREIKTFMHHLVQLTYIYYSWILILYSIWMCMHFECVYKMMLQYCQHIYWFGHSWLVSVPTWHQWFIGHLVGCWTSWSLFSLVLVFWWFISALFILQNKTEDKIQELILNSKLKRNFRTRKAKQDGFLGAIGGGFYANFSSADYQCSGSFDGNSVF